MNELTVLTYSISFYLKSRNEVSTRKTKPRNRSTRSHYFLTQHSAAHHHALVLVLLVGEYFETSRFCISSSCVGVGVVRRILLDVQILYLEDEEGMM